MINAFYQRAMILHQQGRHADAEKELRQAITQEPNDASMHAMLALCLSEQSRFREATEEAQAAIGLGPDEGLAHYALAKVLFDRQRYGEAAAAIEEAIRLETYDADYHALLAAIRLEQRAWPSALEAAEKALEHEPDHASATNLRAMALVKLGRKADAANTLGDALTRDPENAVTHANQGWALLHRGEHVKAMEHFRESLRLDPTSEWARAGIVEALKAHNFVYRWVLMYFLWLGRLSGRAQASIVIGGYFGYRFALNAARTKPDLAPYLWPVVIVYLVFAYTTWLAEPFGNLLLRVHPIGRLALSREQRTSSSIFGLLVLMSIAGFLTFFLTGSGTAFVAGVTIGVYTIPVSLIHRCSPGWPRNTMIAIAACLGVLLVCTLSLSIAADLSGSDGALLESVAVRLLGLYGTAMLLTLIGGQFLAVARPKM